MRIQLAPGFKNTGKNTIGKDVLAGLILMAVSIPISMGYAQIAGLPAVYGLYGSVFPILLFALFSSSPQFIFGVDAAPAALVGAALVNLDIQSESAQAMKVVPVITFMVAVWLLAFLYYESRETGKFHIGTGYGRIYNRNLYHYYLDAGAETHGRNSGNRRISGTGVAYWCHTGQDQCAVSCAGTGVSDYPACGEKMDPEVSYGHCADGSRSHYDSMSSGKTMGRTYIKCGRAWTAGVAATRLYCDFHERGGYHQSVSGSGDHGRDPFGRE